MLLLVADKKCEGTYGKTACCTGQEGVGDCLPPLDEDTCPPGYTTRWCRISDQTYCQPTPAVAATLMQSPIISQYDASTNKVINGANGIVNTGNVLGSQIGGSASGSQIGSSASGSQIGGSGNTNTAELTTGAKVGIGVSIGIGVPVVAVGTYYIVQHMN